MAHKPCEKFTWCDFHDTELDDPDLHSRHIGFGIDFVHDATTGESHVSWQPNWVEWQMNPGKVYTEVEPLKRQLETLAYDFARFVEEVTADAPGD